MWNEDKIYEMSKVWEDGNRKRVVAEILALPLGDCLATAVEFCDRLSFISTFDKEDFLKMVQEVPIREQPGTDLSVIRRIITSLRDRIGAGFSGTCWDDKGECIELDTEIDGTGHGILLRFDASGVLVKAGVYQNALADHCPVCNRPNARTTDQIMECMEVGASSKHCGCAALKQPCHAPRR